MLKTVLEIIEKVLKNDVRYPTNPMFTGFSVIVVKFNNFAFVILYLQKKQSNEQKP